MLNLYNTDTRSLKINKAFGSLNVRAGSSVVVNIKKGNLKLNNNFMVVEKVTHTFESNSHFMDLSLLGGVINNA